MIGIIATLIAILLPAGMSKARQSAVLVQCQSNMKQTYYAIIMYTNEYGGYFPPDTQIEAQKIERGTAAAVDGAIPRQTSNSAGTGRMTARSCRHRFSNRT